MKEIKVYIPWFIMGEMPDILAETIINIRKRIKATLEDDESKVLTVECYTAKDLKKEALRLCSTDYIFAPPTKDPESRSPEDVDFLARLVIIASTVGIKVLSDSELIREDLVKICTGVTAKYEMLNDYEMPISEYNEICSLAKSDKDYRYICRMFSVWNKIKMEKNHDKKSTSMSDDWQYGFNFEEVSRREDPTSRAAELSYRIFNMRLQQSKDQTESLKERLFGIGPEIASTTSACGKHICCCECPDWPYNCPKK